MMRKTMFFTNTLLLLSALVTAGLYIHISAEKDDIQLTETVLFGDRKAAEGISVKLQASDIMQENNWNLSYALEKGGALKTESAYFKEQNEGYLEVETNRRDLSLSVSANVTTSWDIIPAEKLSSDFLAAKFDEDNTLWHFAPMEALIKAAAASTKNGETLEKTFDLRDFTDFLPMELSRDYFNQEYDYILFNPNEGPKGRLDLSYFNMPIPDYLYGVTVKLTKDEEGNIAELEVDSTSNYSFDGSGLIGHSGCYIAVTRLLQTSEDPTGKKVTAAVYPDKMRGIHYIPYRYVPVRYDEDRRCLDMDEAQLVYPLDEDVEVVELLQHTEEDDLQLFTKEKGKIMVTIIDPNTMKAKEKLTLMDNENPDYLVYETYDDCTLVNDYDGRFALIYEQDGKYKVQKGNLYQQKELSQERGLGGYYHTLFANVLPDGRGVILATARPTEIEYTHPRISHYLLVLDEKGMQYAGFYQYAIDCDSFVQEDVGYDENPMIVLNMQREPVTITEAN